AGHGRGERTLDCPLEAAVRGDPVISFGEKEKRRDRRNGDGPQLEPDVAWSEQTFKEGGEAVERLASYPAVFPALQLEHRTQQNADVFTELDCLSIERLVGGTLQSDGTQNPVVLGQRHRANGVLTMLARQRLVGADNVFLMFLPFGGRNDD